MKIGKRSRFSPPIIPPDYSTSPIIPNVPDYSPIIPDYSPDYSLDNKYTYKVF